MGDERPSPTDDLYLGPSVLEPVSSAPFSARLARLILIPLLVILFAVVMVFYVLFSTLRVVGDSMLPNLQDDDRLLLTRRYETPVRGDVVVFSAISRTRGPEDLIKRIVAVPGDRVAVDGGVATVNGLPETTPEPIPDPAEALTIEEMVVPEGYVYVLGDNRPVSLDSRILGPIPIAAIKSEAVFVFAPINRFGVIDSD